MRPPTREETHERLMRERFDLLVVGGGIVGAGIACAAARAGLAVALVEREDFGAGTTGASSKLIHGGLRYLRLGDVGLVREAHAERRVLAAVVAPHLVEHQPFLLPLYEGGPHGPAEIRAGLLLYTALAGFRDPRPRVVGVERARALVPALRTDGLRACGLYADSRTNDSRLCLANVAGAAEAGAAVLNHAAVVGLPRSGGRIAAAEVVDALDGAQLTVTADVVVNAAGPWVDAVRRLEDERAGTSVRLSKGAHVVVPRTENWAAALTVPLDRARVSFAVPMDGALLLGTTDEPFEDDPAAVAVTPADVEQILAEARRAIEPVGEPLAAFAGLRVLPLGVGATARARREIVFSKGRYGLVSVAGGKLTTYRRVALKLLDTLRSELDLHRVDRTPAPLPGAADAASVAAALSADLDPRLRLHLARLYGSRAREVAAAGPLEPLVPGEPETVAQVVYAHEHEWACTADDVLRRRTTMSLRGLAPPDVRTRVESLLAERALA